MSALLAVVIAFTMLALPVRADAQVKHVVIESRVSCPTCRVTFGQPRAYGDDDDPGILPGIVESLARDRRGNLWISSGRGEGAPIIFTAEGRALKPIARKGDGPGELRGPLTIIPTASDTVYLIDQPNARLSVATATGGIARQVSLPPPPAWAGVALRSGSLVLSGSAGGGAPRVISSQGRLLRRFGYVSKYRLGPGPVAPSRGGGVWSARPTAYLIELFDSLGTKQLVLERHADWFLPHDETIPWEVGQEPRPRIVEMFEDDNGRLWVFSSIAGTNWKSGVGPGATVRGRTTRRITDYSEYYNIMIEVLDPRTGELLYSHRGGPDRMGRVLAPGGYAMILDGSEDGRIRVAPFTLTR